MQKSLIVLVLGLLSVGCLTPEQKQEALRDSVVGEYEFKFVNGDIWKRVFLDTGIVELYRNGQKLPEANWSIVDGEIHAKTDDGVTGVLRINPDKSITAIANIEDGKRTDLPKERQHTYKKIK